MFSETYRRMNDAIEPSPTLVAETLAKTRRASRPHLRRPAVMAAVLLLSLCIATPALAAQTETGYQALYQIAPAAAQFFQPVRRTCTDNGVTMEVAAVQVKGDTAQAYITLSGDAVDETCDLFDSWNFHLPFDQIGHCERVGYDETSRTATFLCTTETMDGKPIPIGGKMTFSVGCFLSGRETAEDLTVDVSLADYAVEAETVSAGEPSDAYWRSGGGYSDDAVKALLDASPMLRPGGPIAVPVEGLPITAMGYADGLFHVQVCRGDATQLDNHCWLWLVDENGERLDALYSAGFTSSAEDAARLDYEEYVFDITPEALSHCTLRGDFYTASTLTEGNWRITFPLENT